MIGTQLGHYHIERLLGTGGMGEVYLADDTRLGRRVALKVLSSTLAGDPDRRERFERKARAAAALNHHNIVTIHSVEEADGVPFLTLELIDGQTLTELIPEGGFNTAAGVSNLMRQSLSGGAPTPITQFTSEQIFTYALSPDQKQLAVVRGRVSSDVVLVSTVEKQQ